MLRHACGYALANAGHDTRALQAYLGHRNIQHTVRYTELAPIAALRGLLIDEGLLQWMQLVEGAEPLQRGDLVRTEVRDRHHAGAHGRAVDEHRAGAALRTAATEFRVDDLKALSVPNAGDNGLRQCHASPTHDVVAFAGALLEALAVEDLDMAAIWLRICTCMAGWLGSISLR
jgi:hypothetical protein